VPSSLQTGVDEISHCFFQATGRWYVSRASSGKGQSVNHMEAQFSPTMDFSHSSGGTRAEVFFCAFTRSVAQSFETSFWMILTTTTTSIF